MSVSYPNGGKKNRLEIHSACGITACHRRPAARYRRANGCRVLRGKACRSSCRASGLLETWSDPLDNPKQAQIDRNAYAQRARIGHETAKPAYRRGAASGMVIAGHTQFRRFSLGLECASTPICTVLPAAMSAMYALACLGSSGPFGVDGRTHRRSGPRGRRRLPARFPSKPRFCRARSDHRRG